YQPRGAWEPWPGGPRAPNRRGTDKHVADAGFQYFFVDANLVLGGTPIGVSSGDGPDGEPASVAATPPGGLPAGAQRTPYRAFAVLYTGWGATVVLVRDPRASMQVWSRHQGYPGDAA